MIQYLQIYRTICNFNCDLCVCVMFYDLTVIKVWVVTNTTMNNKKIKWICLAKLTSWNFWQRLFVAFKVFFYNNSLFETTLNKHFNVKMMKETQNISLFIAWINTRQCPPVANMRSCLVLAVSSGHHGPSCFSHTMSSCSNRGILFHSSTQFHHETYWYHKPPWQIT